MSRAAVLVLAMSGAAIAGVGYLQRRAAGEGAAADPELEAGPGVLEQLEIYAAPIAETIKDLVGLGPSAAELAGLVQDPNVAAFLAMIRGCEVGTAGAIGYSTQYGGGQFATFADHPRQALTRILGGRPITSTAAGGYQFLERTWDDAVRALKLSDFSPPNQDIAAVWLIRRRGALGDVRAGRIQAAIAKCAHEWASLPGSPYGQPMRSLDQVLAMYESAGGSIA